MDIKTYLTKKVPENTMVLTLPVCNKWTGFILVFEDGSFTMEKFDHSVDWVEDTPDPIDLCMYVNEYNNENEGLKLLIDERALEAIIGRWILLNGSLNLDLLHATIDYDNILE